MSAMAVKPTVATPLASKKSAFAGRGVAAVAPKTATGGRASLQVRASSALLPRRPRRDASRRGVLRDRVGGRNGGVARDARDRASPPRARSGSVARRAKSVILRVGFHRALSERAREVADAVLAPPLARARIAPRANAVVSSTPRRRRAPRSRRATAIAPRTPRAIRRRVRSRGWRGAFIHPRTSGEAHSFFRRRPRSDRPPRPIVHRRDSFHRTTGPRGVPEGDARPHQLRELHEEDHRGDEARRRRQGAFWLHWFPYDRVCVVNADP